MKYYALGQIDVTDPAWVSEYVTQVTAIVQRRGGRYLARTQRTEMLEGEREAPGTLVLIEWPTREAALAFYDSDEYRPYREDRRRGARNEFILIAGEDVTGVAHIEA
jgi:uncharacterized protein (DUF1330 family)